MPFITEVADTLAAVLTLLSSLPFLILGAEALNIIRAVRINSCSAKCISYRTSFIPDLKLKVLGKTKGGSVTQINSGKVYSSYWRGK